MSVSGGLGQAYEVLFVLLARLRGMKVFLHHHSYAYLNRPSYLTALLVRAAGCGAVHIVLSPRMAEQFGSRYPFGHTLPLSNSAILLCRDFDKARPRRCLQTLGFISNIAAEKGVFEFLDLLEELQELGLSLRGKLAGPCQDAKVEGILRERLASLQNIDYVGPKYGKEKDAFFASIDLLVFPTRYNNEAEPLTVHEAMSRGVPVIAYGRGAIPEIVGSDSGQIIAPSESFVTLAIDQIKMWVDKPILYESVSRSAIRQFSVTYSQNEKRWQCLLNRLMFGNRDSA